ncbi:nucleotide excision repair endonuclease [Paenibacillus pasadenensis]|uniref:Endo/excinuclease amino terminal domain protein n=1 Tax=Paenibacillus pasadenensis TaxID=217090 RepID=A0A2N5NCK3_9BACL|nr:MULTISPECIES: nucleotide excision repair endonuclease [Paenibacillus]PLT48071.1 Endo/excinuclease amino terminal domain protein [Paenibacillus pasadenensis]QGG58400.1 nucleotide excision repair endonuclease [Paenibacillus sp. B01]
MIQITIPKPDVTLYKEKDPQSSHIYGFTDFHRITREEGGIFLFYNDKDELLFVGKARKLRPRIKKHFEDASSVMKNHRSEVAKIEVCLIEEPMHREIYETYLINQLKAKYNIEKVFYK